MPEPLETNTAAPASNNGKQITLKSDVAGASIGTIIASLANALPNDMHAKSYLVILAPGVSVLISWIIQQLYKIYKRWENERRNGSKILRL